jgi:hypothetical protein
MQYYTYAYLREDGTPYYIGKGKDNRAHRRRYKGIKPPKDKNRILILKNNLNEEQAFKHEKYMISVFGRKDLSTGILHNRTDGGEGLSGFTHSEETKQKMMKKTVSENSRKKISNALKGRTISEEHRRKLSDAQKGEKSHSYGKTPSAETKIKLSVAKKGDKNPNYGKIASGETRRKLSDANKGQIPHNKGISHTEETKRKIGGAIKGRKWWNDGCGNCKMMIECPGDGWVVGRK